MYSRGDSDTTAKVIDAAMAADADAPVVLVAQAKILRAESAHAVGEDALADDLVDQVAQVDLTAADREKIPDDLARAQELRLALG
jgi:hypothetical protein